MAMKNISKFIETKDNKHSRIHGKKYFKKSWNFVYIPAKQFITSSIFTNFYKDNFIERRKKCEEGVATPLRCLV